jgi:hypothetical protein
MNQAILNRSRNDKFAMVLDLPKALKSSFDNVTFENYSINPLQFSIYGSPVPSIKVPEIVLPYGGQTYRTSSNARPGYDPLTIKFLVDNGYKNYWLIWNWINLFNDSKTSQSPINIAQNPPINGDTAHIINSMNDYRSRFSIFALDEFNNKTVSFTYTDAFPVALGEINFSNQDPTEINCSVTFAFNQLHVDLIKDVNKVSC